MLKLEIVQKFRGQDFEGYVPLKAGSKGMLNRSHCAPPQFPLNFIPAKFMRHHDLLERRFGYGSLTVTEILPSGVAIAGLRLGEMEAMIW